jgi:PTH1 family peptidyl-tRNA hydrolase
MKLIVGLGNPGSQYAHTRHNIGFMVVDQLALKWGETVWRHSQSALVAEYRTSDRILLVKPQTFMNDSGVAVSALVQFFKVAEPDILIVHDDLDLAVGKLRLRAKGSSGGHRGMESILLHSGKDTVARLKIGIGHPPGMHTVIDHVLTPFRTAEAVVMKDVIAQSVLAVEAWLAVGITEAMNEFNKNK